MSVERVVNPGHEVNEGGLAAEGSSNSCHNGSSVSAELASEVLAQLTKSLPRLLSQQEAPK